LLRGAEPRARFDRLAAVFEQVAVQREVVAAELVPGLLGDTFGERGLGAEPALDGFAPTLDEVRQKALALGRDRAGRLLLEAGIEQTEQRSKMPLCGVAVTSSR
jgi:hypothetical protein